MRRLAFALLALPALAQVLPKVPQPLVDVDLFLALDKGDWKAFREALERGANPNAASPSGLRPLHYCAKLGDGSCYAELLLKAGARLDATLGRPEGFSPLQFAVASHNPLLAELLIKAGADPRQLTPRGGTGGAATLLHIVAGEGHLPPAFAKAAADLGRPLETIDLLLRSGVPLEDVDASGYTAFQRAMRAGNLDVAALLARRGASLLLDPKEGPVLIRAAQAAHPALLEAVLQRGEDSRSLREGRDALHWLTARDDRNPPPDLGERAARCLELLVAAGLPAWRPGEPTLLHTLCAGDWEGSGPSGGGVLERILALGVPLDARDGQGRTPLFRLVEAWAAGRGRGLAPVLRFLDKGAAPDAADAEGRTPLMLAAGTRHYDTPRNETLLRALLDRGADPRRRDGQGRSLFHFLCGSRLELNWFDRFKAAGADSRSADREGCTPLILAAEGGREDLVQKLLLERPDLEQRDAKGRSALVAGARDDRVVSLLLKAGAHADPPSGQPLPTALCAALERGGYAVHLLLAAGADPSRKDDQGRSPLLLALERNDGRTMNLLAEKGARLDPAQGGRALIQILRRGRTDTLPRLLEGGADVNVSDPVDGTTPLMAALEQLEAEIVEKLLQRGASTKARDTLGRGVLECVVRASVFDPENKRRKKCLLLLKEAGADLQERNAEGESLLFVALGRRDFGLALTLLDLGVNPKLKDKNGGLALSKLGDQWSGSVEGLRLALGLGLDPGRPLPCGHPPLLHAVQRGEQEQVRILLAAGADPRWEDGNGCNLLAYASSAGSASLVRTLAAKGLRLSQRDKDSDTPLGGSLFNGHPDITLLLLQLGAKPEDAFRGDYREWCALLAAEPGKARDFVVTRDAAERAKGEGGMPGIWTYGALAVAVLKEDLGTLEQAKRAGLDFAVRPREAPSLADLAKAAGADKAQDWLAARP